LRFHALAGSAEPEKAPTQNAQQQNHAAGVMISPFCYLRSQKRGRSASCCLDCVINLETKHAKILD
jgi:hypothetical protein